MPEQQPTAKSIFLAAIELESVQERQEFVVSECAGNSELAAEVHELLASQPRESYLESPVQPELMATIGLPSFSCISRQTPTIERFVPTWTKASIES